MLAIIDVKELISMFTFQAIHNKKVATAVKDNDVKELISMFTFQAIHNRCKLLVSKLRMSKS